MIPLKDNIPSKRVPFINYAIIFINIAVFFHQIQVNSIGMFESFVLKFGVVPNLLSSNFIGNSYTLFTSQFLHGGWAHIIGNMIYLYIFGDNVEDRLGHGRYILFYLLSGCGASLTQVYFNSGSQIPMIGASGAIAGVLGAYFLLYPKAKVLAIIPLGLFSRIMEIPALFFLGFWFVFQAFSGTVAIHSAKALGPETGGIAWFAHSGGFVVGGFYVLLFVRRRKR